VLRVDKRSGFCVELGDRSLGVSDSAATSHRGQSCDHERIGDVGFVVTGDAVSPWKPVATKVALPAGFKTSTWNLLIEFSIQPQ